MYIRRRDFYTFFMCLLPDQYLKTRDVEAVIFQKLPLPYLSLLLLLPPLLLPLTKSEKTTADNFF